VFIGELQLEEVHDATLETWLESSPLISIDAKQARRQARKPYPLSWEEQDLLLEELPADPNAQMALFKVNTGTREQEVCKLRWQWEVPQAPTARSGSPS
jgi:integrase